MAIGLNTQYADKILDVRNYESDKDDFGVVDFLNMDTLYDFIWEVANGESDVTPAGLAFMRECLDMAEIARQWRTDERQLPPHGVGKNDDERIKYFLEYIDSILPMEMALLLANHRAQTSGDNSHYTLENLRDELQPPENKRV